MIPNKEICNDIMNASRSLEMVSELLGNINSLCDGNCEITSYEDDDNKVLVSNLVCTRIPIYNQMLSNSEYVLTSSMFYVTQAEFESLKRGTYVGDYDNKAFGNFMKKNLENNQDFSSKLRQFIGERFIINKGKKFKIYGLVEIKHIPFSNDLILANEISDKLKDSSICLYKVTVIDDIYDRENMSDITDSTCDKIRKIRCYANENDFAYLDVTIESNDNIASMIKSNLVNYYPNFDAVDVEVVKKSNFQSAELINNAITDLQKNSQGFFSSTLSQFKDVKHDSIKIVAEMISPTPMPSQSIKIYFNDIILIDYTINFYKMHLCRYVIDFFNRLDNFFNLTTNDLISKNISKLPDFKENWGEW